MKINKLKEKFVIFIGCRNYSTLFFLVVLVVVIRIKKGQDFKVSE